ncbi:MAG: DUF3102 domain-containing protein [Clostridia bacterium]|nr:DUF3102 domain-containing protein [Clostridia bacterium]
MALTDLNKVEMIDGEYVDKTQELVPARASEIAMEINIIKRRAAEGLLKDAIEIGRLLCEAKETVPHGAWGDWLRDNVSYSTSTANNMMRLYNEQERAAQLDLFGENGFEMFEGLAPSKVVELMRLPSAERREFMESHNVADMSAREIKKEIKAEREKREAAEAEVSALKGEIANVKQAAEDALHKASIAEDARMMLSDKLDEANRALEQMEAQKGISPEERAEIEAAAKKAADEAAAKRIEAAKKKAEKDLEKARAEGADAVKKVEAERDAAIGKAKEEAKAEAERAAAAKIAALEEQLRAAAANASPFRAKFGSLFEALQDIYRRMHAVVEEAEREDPSEGEILRGILSQIPNMLEE